MLVFYFDETVRKVYLVAKLQTAVCASLRACFYQGGLWNTACNTSSILAVVFFGAFVVPIQLQNHTRIFRNRFKACHVLRKGMRLGF